MNQVSVRFFLCKADYAKISCKNLERQVEYNDKYNMTTCLRNFLETLNSLIFFMFYLISEFYTSKNTLYLQREYTSKQYMY